MNCKAYRIEIEEVEPGGGLSPRARAHVEVCDECRLFLRERTALRSLLADIGKVRAPADFEFRLRARIGSGTRTRRGGFAQVLFRPAALAALASCLAVAAVALLLVRQPSQTLQQARIDLSPADIASPATQPEAPADGETKHVSTLGGDASRVKVGDEVARNVRASNSASRRPKGEASFRKGGEVRKAHFASRRAGVLTREGAEAIDVATLNAPVPVQVPSSKQSMKVVFRDENGASRTVSMNPVSFGGQEFVGRVGNVARTSNAAKEGVW